MTEEHVTPIKSPKQLLIVVFLAFVIPITVILLLSQLVTGGDTGLAKDENALLTRIAPVGQFVAADPSVPKGVLTGEQVYGKVCKTCHETGLAGAHKFGDKAAWAKVIAQGPDTTFSHALNGIRAMPARGGSADLTDDEVKRAVVYMLNNAGAGWKDPTPAPAAVAAAAPAAPGAAARPAAAAAPAPAVVAAAAPAPAAAAAAGAKPDGKKIYESTCVVCHGAGIAGAPKFGDHAAWAPRLKTGMDALYTAALKGKNAMPAKGGNTALSDADVKAAVDFMAAAAK